jgi:hypothetical protein
MQFQDERRAIYCRLVDDLEFQSLPPEAQRLWFFLRVSPECGPFGLFRFYPEILQARMRAVPEQIESALRILEAGRWVVREKGWLLLRNAMRYEAGYVPAKNPKHLRHLHTHLRGLFQLGIAWDLLTSQGLPYPSEWVSNGYRRPTDSLPVNSNSNRDSDRESGTTSMSLFPEAQVDEEPTKVVTAFNEILGAKLGEVKQLSAARMAAARARLREDKLGLEGLKDYFRSVLRCPFLLGKNKDDWRATYDWLMRPSNMAKVKDGNYMRKGPAGRTPRDFSGVGKSVEVGRGTKPTK